PVLITTLPTAADMLVAPDGDLIVAGQGALCSGCIYKVNIGAGTYVTKFAGNNNNTLSLDPSGTKVYAGWYDTLPSEVPPPPFATGATPAVPGDNPTFPQIAFPPSDGVFYTTGSGGTGAFGQITLGAGYVTDRILTGVPATGIHYDSFSHTLILSGAGS